jgi:hypothetical protein
LWETGQKLEKKDRLVMAQEMGEEGCLLFLPNNLNWRTTGLAGIVEHARFPEKRLQQPIKAASIQNNMVLRSRRAVRSHFGPSLDDGVLHKRSMKHSNAGGERQHWLQTAVWDERASSSDDVHKQSNMLDTAMLEAGAQMQRK